MTIGEYMVNRMMEEEKSEIRKENEKMKNDNQKEYSCLIQLEIPYTVKAKSKEEAKMKAIAYFNKDLYSDEPNFGMGKVKVIPTRTEKVQLYQIWEDDSIIETVSRNELIDWLNNFWIEEEIAEILNDLNEEGESFIDEYTIIKLDWAAAVVHFGAKSENEN